MRQYFSKQNRALLSELVRTDFKLRYQGSVLGYAWSLLRPLLFFLVLYVVLNKFLKIGNQIDHPAIYLLLGVVLWNFFGEMTSQSLGSVVGRGDLIRKISIPRWIIVFSSSISALISLGFSMIIVAVFMIINQVHLTATILMLPLLLTEAYLFGLGISLFLSAAFVKYRDISYIWEVILQAGFYLTPIFYLVTMITNPLFQKILLINPIAQVIQDARYTAITHQTMTGARLFDGGWYMFIPFIIVVVVLIGGGLYFKAQAKYFAENV